MYDAPVFITIDPVNDPPVAVNDSETTEEETPVTITVLSNDYDIDGDTLTTTSVVNYNPRYGEVTLNEDGTFEYTPDPDHPGQDSFAYQISDGNGGLATATGECWAVV